MNKPVGYDNAQAYTGDYERLELGGHYLIIKGAKMITVNGNEYLSIAFDCDRDDKQAGYFQRLFENRRGDSVLWPMGGTIRYGTSEQGLPFLKGFIKSVEESNPGYVWNWDEKTLNGKRFGGVFGEEEYQDKTTGAVKTSIRCRFARSIEAIRKGVNVPDKKLPKGAGTTPMTTTAFANAIEADDEELPF